MMQPTRRLFFKAVLLSFALHFAFLFFFYTHPFVFSPLKESLFQLGTTTPEMLEWEELESKNQMMEEAFEQIVLLSPHQQRPFDGPELPRGRALAPDAEGVQAFLVDVETPRFPTEMSFATEATQEMSPGINEEVLPIFPSAFEPVPLASQLEIDSPSSLFDVHAIKSEVAIEIEEGFIASSEIWIIPDEEEVGVLSLDPVRSETAGEKLGVATDPKMLSGRVAAHELALKQDVFHPTLFIPEAAPLSKGRVDHARFESIDPKSLPPIATAATWNEDFSASVSFLSNPEGQGYIFSITLSPNEDISDYSLKQNVYFVIDRSGSTSKHRFSSFKRSVLKALSSIQSTDTFNILLVDKKIASFRKQNCIASSKNIQAAEEFLEKEEAKGFFSSGEIYTSLEKCLTHIPDDGEMHTIVLLSDGKTRLSTEKKQQALKSFVKSNRGRVALYAAAVGRDNDLVTLDLLSSVSGGSLLYSDTHASFPRKLSKLMLDLKNPVAKEIVLEAVPHNRNAAIDFYPGGSHLPALFSSRPYVIYGKIDQPCEFELLVQGRHRDDWIAIRKEISFYDGKKGDRELASRFGAQLANLCYTKFLSEGKEAHLKEAKEILKKTRTTASF